MSHALKVLPQVWATAAQEGASAPVTERKRPHRVRVAAESSPRVRPVCRPKLALVRTAAPAARTIADPELAVYRRYTEALLRRYQTLSMESGRVPSLLGREMFRGKVTSYRVHGFDDVVIFVHDVGRCLEQLDAGAQHLVRRVALQEYTQGETAAMTGLSLRTVVRRYAEALDSLSRLFLERKLLEPFADVQEG